MTGLALAFIVASFGYIWVSIVLFFLRFQSLEQFKCLHRDTYLIPVWDAHVCLGFSLTFPASNPPSSEDVVHHLSDQAL